MQTKTVKQELNQSEENEYIEESGTRLKQENDGRTREGARKRSSKLRRNKVFAPFAEARFQNERMPVEGRCAATAEKQLLGSGGGEFISICVGDFIISKIEEVFRCEISEIVDKSLIEWNSEFQNLIIILKHMFI